MTRQRLTVLDRGDGTAVLTGWRGHKTAFEAGIKTVFNGVAGGWVMDASRLSRFVAYCDHRRIALDMVIGTGASRSEPDRDAVPTTGPDQVVDLDVPFDLFDGGDAA